MKRQEGRPAGSQAAGTASPKNSGHSFVSNLTGPFVVIMAVVLLVAVVTVLVSQQRSYRQHLVRQSELQRELERAEAESQSLASLLENVDSDEYVEQIAREELGMVRPGEIIFESPGSRIGGESTATQTINSDHIGAE